MTLFRWLELVLWFKMEKQRAIGTNIGKMSKSGLPMTQLLFLFNPFMISHHKKPAWFHPPAQTWVHRSYSLNTWWFPYKPNFSFYLEKHFLLIRHKGYACDTDRSRCREDQLKDFSIGTKVFREEIFFLRKRKQESTHSEEPTDMGKILLQRSSRQIGKVPCVGWEILQ